MNWSVDHRVEMEHPHHLPTFDTAQGNRAQSEQLPPIMPNSGKGKGKRLRDWDEAETSVLLECVKSPHFRHQKRNQYYMKWDAIAEEIQNRLVRSDSAITGKRCKERMKTLKGYYQQVRSKKKKAGVTEAEWRKSNGIAVDWWYEAIGDFRGPREGKSMSKLNARESANEQIAEKFNSLNDWRRSTLLDLRFFADYFSWRAYVANGREPSVSDLCGWLSIVQNRSCLAIYEDVIALRKMGLVRTCQPDDESGEGSYDDGEVMLKLHIELSSPRVYKKFLKKVMERNPAYDIRKRIEDEAMVTFDAMCAPPGITVLNLHQCEQLEVVDLSGFRKLRIVSIWECPKLRELVGLECLKELGRLEIRYCPSYQGYPPLQKFPSLQEFRFSPIDSSGSSSSRDLSGGELDVSGCACLRTLEIVGDDALSSIRGLEGLGSLSVLEFWSCRALENLPDIGHMKDLTRLSIDRTAVEEIKGVEKLSSLKELLCWGSKLKTLPDLSHLPYLQYVDLDDCSVVDDPSSPYYKQPNRKFNRENKHVDVSDVSDTERDLSSEET